MGPIGQAENQATTAVRDVFRTVGAGDARLGRWRCLTLSLMVLGYSGYYLCRSDLSVATPLILKELAASGMDEEAAKVRLGSVVTAGVLAYALGKLLGGGLGDFLGGRRNFLIGMAGAVVFTAMFALAGSFPLFTAAWAGNRMLQAVGWPGMVKISSRWFSFSSYGVVMGIMSLSFLWGDSINRFFMGFLLDRGLGWRGVFAVAASIMSALLLLTLLLLKESPAEVGLGEPSNNPENIFGAEGADPRPPSPRALLIPLLRSPVFRLVCLLSFGLTLIRESFNAWSATYFSQAIRLPPGESARMSALFPLFGGVSVLLSGYLGDRLGRGGRGAVMLIGLMLAAVALMALGRLDPAGPKALPIVLVSAVGLLVIGPYSYLAGAMALDLGGKRGGATASALIDFVGYLGGALSGTAIAKVSVAYGWRGVFTTLAGAALASAGASARLVIAQRRPAASPARRASIPSYVAPPDLEPLSGEPR